MKFKSNLLGSLGAGVNVKPNTINFSTVFNNLGKKFLENIAVVVTVLGVIVVYVPVTVFLRQLDLADIIKVLSSLYIYILELSDSSVAFLYE